MQSETKYILPALVVLLALVGGYYWFAHYRSVPQSSSSNTIQKIAEDTVASVVRADEGVKTIPEGFPKDIPVGPIITESYRADYNSRGVIQYTVGYVTKTSIKDVLKKYGTYLKGNGYENVASSDAYISGSKSGNTLSVSVGPSSGTGENVVTVNLLTH